MSRSPAGIAVRVALVAALAAGLGGLTATAPSSAQDADPTLVEVQQATGGAWGTVKGRLTDSGRAFYHIPYGAAARWTAPRAAAATQESPWDSTARTADGCAQPATMIGIDNFLEPGPTTEDCLFLDVNTPDPRIRPSGAPVMVFFHGGAFFAGSKNLYDAGPLAATGAVVVSVNYRLGAFGFLGLPGLAQEDRKAVGNYGIMDQQLALRWVRANAAAFGGDPGNVTIFGESAGSGSVCAHLVSPESQGLFHRAILQSGPCSPTTSRPLQQVPSIDDTVARSIALRESAGCDDLACLRRKSTAEIITADAPNRTWLIDLLQRNLTPWRPTYGPGLLLPRDPASAIAASGVPVLIGSNREEFTTLILAGMESFFPEGITEATYLNVLRWLFPGRAQAVAGRYPAQDSAGYSISIGSAITDGLVACATLDTARTLAGRPAGTYLYEFSEPTPARPEIEGLRTDVPLHAYHGSELDYLFNIRPFDVREYEGSGDYDSRLPDAADRQLSQVMLDYWFRFAATGDPNGDGAPAAPAMTTGPVSQAQVLGLDTVSVGPREGFWTEHRCDFWLARAMAR